VVRPAGQAQLPGVGLDHRDGVAEALPQAPGPPRMSLDGDDAGTGLHQRRGQRARARPDVEHDRTGTQLGVSDEPLGPVEVELVPPPPPL
jgi:hypothetical protein